MNNFLLKENNNNGEIMKKYKRIAYSILVLIIFILVFTIYKVYSKTNEPDVNDKTFAELKKIENDFQNLFNELYNVKLDNYAFYTSQIEENSGNETSKEKSQNGDKNDEQQGEKNESSNNETQSEASKKENLEKYNLKEIGILTSKEEINWEAIKNNVEKDYSNIYNLTLDLYKTNVKKDSITNFNNEYDLFAKAIKEENKENTLKELSNLYNYLPQFYESVSKTEKDKIVIRTKNNIYKAYILLEIDNWQEMENNINNAIGEYSNIFANVKENKNQYDINKAYIIINELQNAVKLKDKEIFLIKYKNLLEELNNI